MRVLAVPALLALPALALSGCVLEDHCGPTADAMTWTEPGLYAALHGAPAAADAGLEWDGGDGLLPWEGPAPWPGTRLATVAMAPPRPDQHERGFMVYADPHLSRLVLEREGVVRAHVEGEPPEAAVRAVLRAFLENVSAADAAALDAAVDALVASRIDDGARVAIPLDDEGRRFEERTLWRLHAAAPGPLRLDALAAEVGVGAPAPTFVGQAQATADGWTFTFSLPTWTFGPEPGEREPRLTVDAADRVVYDGSDGTEEGLRAQAQGHLATLGWTDPAFQDAEASVYVC